MRKITGKMNNNISVAQGFPSIMAYVKPIEYAKGKEIGMIKIIPQILYFIFFDFPKASKKAIGKLMHVMI